MKTIIRKSIITEKATSLTEKRNSYTFEVEFKSNKLEIKGAIEKLYNVRVTGVRTMNYGGGVSSVKFTNKGIVEQKSKQWKKAVVTVADGQFIELFNNY
jgi:large subunit ribosomal protein L23